MYCSSCGTAVAHNLIYCNNCGEKLSAAKDDNVIKSSEVKPELLVSSMVALFIFGLVAIAILIGVMKQVAGFDLPILIAFTIFSFLLMLLVEGVLIGLLLKHKKADKQVGDTKQLNEQATKELYAEPARVLTEPVSSVTERTTNLLEPIYREQKSK